MQNNICDSYSDSLPQVGFIRLSTVLKMIPVSKSTWWEGVKTGKFPKAVKLGQRTTAWCVEDIRKLIEEIRENSEG
jgi:prophage regulatory protein